MKMTDLGRMASKSYQKARTFGALAVEALRESLSEQVGDLERNLSRSHARYHAMYAYRHARMYRHLTS